MACAEDQKGGPITNKCNYGIRTVMAGRVGGMKAQKGRDKNPRLGSAVSKDGHFSVE